MGRRFHDEIIISINSTSFYTKRKQERNTFFNTYFIITKYIIRTSTLFRNVVLIEKLQFGDLKD